MMNTEFNSLFLVTPDYGRGFLYKGLLMDEIKRYAIKVLDKGAFYGWIMFDQCSWFIVDDISIATIFTTRDLARAKLHELEYKLDYELKIIELRGIL